MIQFTHVATQMLDLAIICSVGGVGVAILFTLADALLMGRRK